MTTPETLLSIAATLTEASGTLGGVGTKLVEAAALLERRGSADPVDLYRERYAETAGAEDLARLQDVDLGIYLVDDLLVKTDRMSMVHSLEARVPFLDQVVAELARRAGEEGGR